MIPLELNLVNFLAYRDPGPLSFEGVHVACLAGPNGAGKSSLLDAITWAMWGKARSNSADDLIHQGETEMSVELEFVQGGQRHRVMRQRSSGKRGSSLLELQIWDSEGSSWRSLAGDSIRETQVRIDEVVRLDYETFVNSAFLLQGRADEFTTKTPSQRKQILSNILGLDLWESYEARTKEAAREVENSIRMSETRLEEMESELGHRQGYEQELAQAETDAAEKAQTLAKAEKEWASLEGSRKELVTLQRQIDEITRRLVARQKEIKQAQEELAAAESRADEISIQAALQAIEAEISQLLPLEEEEERLRELRSHLVEEAAGLRGANEALVPETEPLKTRITALEAADEPLCPTCGQPLGGEHRQRLLHDLQHQIEERRDLFRRNKDRVQVIESESKDLEGELSQLKAQLKKRSHLEKRKGELEAGLEHAVEAAKSAGAIRAKLDRWQAEVDGETEQRTKIEEAAVKTETMLRQAALTEADLDGIRREKRIADERVGGARQRLQALDKLIEQAQAQSQRLKELGEELSLLDELKVAFGKQGVPAMIIETVVPELERNANELLGRMTDGRLHVRIETQREIKTGAVREALDIIISDELGSRSYELYSGGEAFRINFAIRIALSKLLANRAGAELRSLYIDEGFGTQDAQGREQLVEAINRVQDDFDRILVITHIEELKDSFPVRIEVRKTEQGSVFRLN
jgi:exonuclease SbcC